MSQESKLPRLGAVAAAIDRQLSPEAVAKKDVLSGCFPEQRAFIQDPSPFKVGFCTRRAAKSYSVALEDIDDSFSHPFAHYLILGLSRPEMKDIYWDNILKEIDRKHDLGAVFNETELTMRMPNGALIKIAGADQSEKEKRKFLGGKKRKIAIDECQAFATDLRELVYGTLKPSVADYRGSISCVGTPGNLTAGFFHALTNGCRAGALGPQHLREAGWSVHTWNTFHNPYMAKQWTEEIADLQAMNPLVVEVPWFRQNYLGEWVVDLDALCYKFNPLRNAWDGKLPTFERHQRRGEWHYLLAIDLGYHPDPSAFVVLAYHDYDTRLFMLESWKQWRMDITDVAQKVGAYQALYSFDAYVIDGANKQAVEEMRRRHGLDLTCADKTGKSDFIELMNAELVQGRILIDTSRCNQGIPLVDLRSDRKVTESLALVDEYAGLVWDPRKLLLNKREEHPACPNHLCDAALYGWRHAYQYLSRAPEIPLKPFTPAWFAAEAARMQEQAIEELQARQALDPPAGLGDSSDWDPRLLS